jgi:hypothetical protein
LDAESPPENKKKEHLVSGVFISPYLYLMQGVSECESVVFLGPPPAEGGRRPHAEAAASPQGWPPPKTSLSFRRFLIANGISLLNRPT